jgi:plastocyanin
MLKLLRLTLLIAALTVATIAVAACGGSDEDGNGNDGTTSPAATTPSGDGGGGEIELDVSMGDNFFEPAKFTVDAGAELTFSITNDGAAIHNMRVAGADNEFNTGDDAVSQEELIPAGDTATLQWTAPAEPGVYDFQCDFHVPDMAGTVTVE